mmetsp:Transcript_10485/g.25631  ORF Transcript_10485/g.25631 Transcript_10485/m.25631 type:complete len:176 (-) Transcript_10485:136-663(-)|eukprot:g4600.t1
MGSPGVGSIWEALTAYPPPTPVGMVQMGPNPTMRRHASDAYSALLLAAQNKRNAAIAVKKLQQLGQEVRTNANRAEASAEKLEKEVFLTKLRLFERVKPEIVGMCRRKYGGRSEGLWERFGGRNRDEILMAATDGDLEAEGLQEGSRECEQLADFLMGHKPGIGRKEASAQKTLL